MGRKAKKTPPSRNFDAALIDRVSNGRFGEEVASAAVKFRLALNRDHPLVADDLYLRSLAHHFLVWVLFVDEYFGATGEVRASHIKKAMSRIEEARAELQAAHEALVTLATSLAAVTDAGYSDDGQAILIHPWQTEFVTSIEESHRGNARVEIAARKFLSELKVPAADKGGHSLTEHRRGRSAQRFARHLAQYYVAQGKGLYGSGANDFAETLRALWRAADGGDLPSEADLLSELRAADLLGPPAP